MSFQQVISLLWSRWAPLAHGTLTLMRLQGSQVALATGWSHHQHTSRQPPSALHSSPQQADQSLQAAVLSSSAESSAQPTTPAAQPTLSLLPSQLKVPRPRHISHRFWNFLHPNTSCASKDYVPHTGRALIVLATSEPKHLAYRRCSTKTSE